MEVINDLLRKKACRGNYCPGLPGVKVSPEGKKIERKQVEAVNFKDVEWIVLVVMDARPLTHKVMLNKQ